MTSNPEHNLDPNENSARIVAESTAGDSETPAEVEAAWQAWASQIQNVDERGMTLLKAAFEAGYDAAQAPAAVTLGRQGGRKGG